MQSIAFTYLQSFTQEELTMVKTWVAASQWDGHQSIFKLFGFKLHSSYFSICQLSEKLGDPHHGFHSWSSMGFGPPPCPMAPHRTWEVTTSPSPAAAAVPASSVETASTPTPPSSEGSRKAQRPTTATPRTGWRGWFGLGNSGHLNHENCYLSFLNRMEWILGISSWFISLCIVITGLSCPFDIWRRIWAVK